MIWGILIWVAAFIAKLVIDIRLFKRGKRNHHSLGPALVLIAIVVSSWLQGWWFLPLALFGWWALFDPAYALGIGKHPSYIGTTAKLDILQRRYPVLVWLKYILFIASLILYIWKQ